MMWERRRYNIKIDIGEETQKKWDRQYYDSRIPLKKSFIYRLK